MKKLLLLLGCLMSVNLFAQQDSEKIETNEEMMGRIRRDQELGLVVICEPMFPIVEETASNVPSDEQVQEVVRQTMEHPTIKESLERSAEYGRRHRNLMSFVWCLGCGFGSNANGLPLTITNILKTNIFGLGTASLGVWFNSKRYRWSENDPLPLTAAALGYGLGFVLGRTVFALS